MKRPATLLAASLAMSLMIVVPVGAHERSGSGSERLDNPAPVVVENRSHAYPVPAEDTIGWTELVRSKNQLNATTFVRGLKPGGVYTFWWVAPYEFDNGKPVIPAGVFVAKGAGTVVGDSGTALVRMKATINQPGILGLPALEGAKWHKMQDPQTSIVRVEIAYHGQASEASGPAELRTWLSDIWTGAGDLCATNTIEGQPHCPVYMASTHIVP
jgi:hypothetical protein